MAEWLHNSLIARFLAAVWSTLRLWWSQSALRRFGNWWSRTYRQSVSRRLWLAWGESRDPAATSFYHRVMAKLRSLVAKLGDWFRQGLIWRGLQSLGRAYAWLSERSRILSLLNHLSARQWLLLAFSWYLPLEFLIRDTLRLGLLASVWEEAFLALAVLLVLWRIALRRSRAIGRETTLDAWLLLFMAVGFFLMSVNQPYPQVAVPGYRIVVQYMLWYFIIIRLLEDDKDLKVLLAGFVILLAVLALHGLYQYAVGVPIPESWTTSTEAGVRTRVFSLTGSPNILGSLLVLLAPLAAAGLYYFHHRLAKLACLALVLISMLTLLFTFSRGAWLGMILAVALFSLFVDGRLLALMGAAMAAVLVCVPSITSRITFLFSTDYAEATELGGRAFRWATGLSLLRESHPWLGYGLGMFGGAVAMHNKLLDETEDFYYFYMDNYYMKTLVEMGYIGLIAFILLLIAVLYVGVKAIQRSDRPFRDQAGDALVRAEGNMRLWTIAIFCGLSGVMLHCYFENIFEEPYMSSYFWGLAAAMLYLGFFRRKPGGDDKIE